jgi:predicted PurR-regulated permease PerM
MRECDCWSPEWSMRSTGFEQENPMVTQGDKTPAPPQMASLSVDIAIRIGLLGLLLYWSLKVIGPFLTVALWSAILTVALYPLFDWLARGLGSRRLAATLITLLCLAIVIGPVTWLGFGLIGSVDFVIKGFDSRILSIPLPAESVKGWPLVGEQVYRLWTLAATDVKAILLEAAPTLKPLGSKLLDIAGTVVFGLLEFVAAIIIAGFLYSPGPQLAATLGAVLRRIFGQRSGEMLKLAGSTIRNVSRGVVGVALLQSFLAGVGFLAAGIPAAGFFSFIALVLGIIQIGPTILFIPIVAWSWTALETTNALIFTAYMVAVGLVDNVLRPFVMAHGLSTPMPIIFIGVVGGTLAYGISGLFVGPIVLSVTWTLLVAWAQDDGSSAPGLSSTPKTTSEPR